MAPGLFRASKGRRLASFFLGLFPLAAAAATPLPAQVAAELRESGVPGAAVAALQAGGPGLAFGVGRRDLLHPEDAVGPDTLFKLGSLSKSVTALAAALLVEESRLAWDAPLSRWLPELVDADPRVAGLTLRQLLSHRSGLDLDRLEALLWPQPNAYTGADLVAGIAALRSDPREAPGFHYSNVNYALAGLAISRAAGQPFTRLVAERVFKPLGMDCTMGGFSRADLPDLAQPHRMASGRPEPVRTDPGQVDEGLDAAAGGLRCRARGLQPWLRYHLSPAGRPPGLSEAGWRELHRAEALVAHRFAPDDGALQAMEAYGLGLQFIGDARGLRIDHYGGLAGVAAYLAVDPARRSAYAIALNADAPATRARLMRLVEQVLGLPAPPVRPPRPASPPAAMPAPAQSLAPEAARALQGRWRDAWFGEVQLCPRDASLGWRSLASPRLTGRLVQTAGGEVQLRWDDPSIQSDARVMRDSDGLRLQALGAADFDFSALRLSRAGDCP